MRKQRESPSLPAFNAVDLSEVSSGKLNRGALNELFHAKAFQNVTGWVAAEQQYFFAAPDRPYVGSPARRNHSNPPINGSMCSVQLSTSVAGQRLRTSTAAAQSPTRMAREAMTGLCVNDSERPVPKSEDRPDWMGERVLSSASSSASVEIRNDDVRFDVGPSSVENTLGGMNSVSAPFDSSRPPTPAYVEARGGQVPRAHRADLSTKQVYLILLFVASAFVFVSYPTDTAVERQEIQMIFSNPPTNHPADSNDAVKPVDALAIGKKNAPTDLKVILPAATADERQARR